MKETRFTLKKTNRGISDDEIIDDIKKVAKFLGVCTLTYKEYRGGGGKIDTGVIHRRIGSWNKALKQAGLNISREVNISDQSLFENIRKIWERLGRQPTRREIDSELSKYSSRPYVKRFGTWTASLESFVNYIEGDVVYANTERETNSARRTSRDPSLRLRFYVMRRDRFRCCHCGASPATDAGVEFHIDHIIPWSKGGETLLENLQTLCNKCNLGKSNERE